MLLHLGFGVTFVFFTVILCRLRRCSMLGSVVRLFLFDFLTSGFFMLVSDRHRLSFIAFLDQASCFHVLHFCVSCITFLFCVADADVQ